MPSRPPAQRPTPVFGKPETALAFYTECQLATLDDIQGRARSSRHHVHRHREIAADMVQACGRWIAVSDLPQTGVPRLKESLRSPEEPNVAQGARSLRSLGEAFAYFTQCQIATLCQLEDQSGSSRSGIHRQKAIVDGMLDECRRMVLAGSLDIERVFAVPGVKMHLGVLKESEPVLSGPGLR